MDNTARSMPEETMPHRPPIAGLDETTTLHDPVAPVETTSQLVKHELTSNADFIMCTVGALDQALLTILHFRNAPLESQPPRSAFFDIVRSYHLFRKRTELVSQAKFILTAGSLAYALYRDWRETTESQSRRSFHFYYRVASLAAASALIPWLILRKE